MPSKELLILLGGAWHDFKGFAEAAAPILKNMGYASRITYDYNDLLELDQRSLDCILSYTSMGNAIDRSGRKGTDFTPTQSAALEDWVAKGNGFVGVHCASVAAKESESYSRLIGGRFLSHPEPLNFTVEIEKPDHPLCSKVTAFEVFDEFYIQDLQNDIDVAMTAKHKGKSYPMVWNRNHQNGKVAYIGPGHFPEVWKNPIFIQLLENAVQWTTQKC